ncbi:MAG: manganese efflux pump MntP family protein [Ignavibacteria bacterium]|jgi:putative Mn2+ efflux pump MntP|nr:manganese efflux pump MntP family protein [Ignavibacteria bacterium]
MLFQILNSIILGLALSVDSFSIACAVGCFFSSIVLKEKLKLVISFMVFHFCMLLGGWLFGDYLIQYVEQFGHWISFALLAFIGIKMLKEATGDEDDEEKESIKENFFGFRNLIFLAFATSIDALAIGFSFALSKTNIWLPNITITIIVGIITLLGLSIGKRLSQKFPERMEIIAGIVLILLGIGAVLEHYFL